ncbi:MAG: hypothetical protein K0T00_230 [Gaiellaceae bacterium]|nr:hypothetical protein [Gaiellaceae bacterium]
MPGAAVHRENGDGEAVPDLGALGQPLEGSVKQPDGSRSPYLFPQTKLDNCEDLRRELVTARPTDEELARWHLTRREYEHFLELARGRPAAAEREP